MIDVKKSVGSILSKIRQNFITLILLLIAFIFTYFTTTQYGIYYTVISFLIMVVGLITILKTRKLAKEIGEKTIQADKSELEREDDVILDAIIFSQSAILLYINLIPLSNIENYKTFINIAILSVAIVFYAIRAYAKIKNSPKYRYCSIWVLFFVIIESCFVIFSYVLKSIIKIGTENQLIFLIGQILSYALIIIMQFISEKFGKRYGYKNSAFLVH